MLTCYFQLNFSFVQFRCCRLKLVLLEWNYSSHGPFERMFNPLANYRHMPMLPLRYSFMYCLSQALKIAFERISPYCSELSFSTRCCSLPTREKHSLSFFMYLAMLLLNVVHSVRCKCNGFMLKLNWCMSVHEYENVYQNCLVNLWSL